MALKIKNKFSIAYLPKGYFSESFLFNIFVTTTETIVDTHRIKEIKPSKNKVWLLVKTKNRIPNTEEKILIAIPQ